MSNTERITENINTVLENIRHTMQERVCGDDNVRLLAVTKNVCVEEINHAISQGINLLGENRVQELLEKYDSINKENIEIHFIGRLQTNKVKYIVDKVTMIHSLDSVRLAEEINKQSKKINKIINVLIQVNIGDEETKGGVRAEHIYDFISQIKDLSNIKICGLMVIPPPTTQNRKNIKYFQEIYKMFVDIKKKNIHNIDMLYLSAGMSDDYAEAIIEGSNIVRVGKNIFGR